MKFLKIFSTSFLVLLSITYSFSVMAAKSHQQKFEESIANKVPVKCYVEYRSGGDDIRLAVGDFSNANQAKSLLLNQVVTPNKSQKMKKKVILKVKECVKEEENFSNTRAKTLDEAIPR